MALRCLRLARAGSLTEASLGRAAAGRGPEVVAVPRRYLREKNPEDHDVFGTAWLSSRFKTPHPRNLGIVPYTRPLGLVLVLGVGGAFMFYTWKTRKDTEKLYDAAGLIVNYNEEIEKRQAIRSMGWNPPSYPKRPGLINYPQHMSNPERFSDDPLIPSAPFKRDPGVSEDGGFVRPHQKFTPWAKAAAFLDLFFPDPFNELLFHEQAVGWDRYVSRDMVKKYQNEIDHLQELAADGAFSTISQEEYERRIAAWVEEHGPLPEEMLRLTVGGEPVWIDPSYSPLQVFQMAQEGKLPDSPPVSEDSIPPADLTKKKRRRKKKRASKDEESPPPPPEEEKPKEEPEPSTPALPELPPHVTYVIIGAGTAAFSAVRGIKRSDPNARVLVIGEETHLPYMRPPLSKELWIGKPAEETPAAVAESKPESTGEEGKDSAAPAVPAEGTSVDQEDIQFVQWNGKARSIYYEPKDYYMQPSALKEDEKLTGVALLTGHKVVALDPNRQRITLDTEQSLTYNRCLIATGGQPINLPSLASASDEVKERTHLFRNIGDYQRLEELTREGKTVAIIGGGFLGSELACSLGKRAKETGGRVVQVFPETGNMARVLPAYLSEWTTQKVRNEGVEVVSHAAVVGAKFNGARVELATSQGESIEADHIVVAVGIRPNTDLAQGARLELDERRGGYLVNSELEARSNVWVAGDASCFYDANLGRRRVEHHDHAVVSGRLAGENMAGQQKTYMHQSMFWSDLGPEVGYEAIGVCDSTLPTVAVWAKATAKDTPAAAAASAEGDNAMRSETEEQASAPKENEAPKPKKSKKSKKAKKAEEEQSAAPAPASVKEVELVNQEEKTPDPESFGKGVVFYMREKKVVGILLWNVFNRMPVARKVIADAEDHEDLTELAKHFNLHE